MTDGIPSIVERVKVAPPGSQLGPITVAQRHALIESSLVTGVYEKRLDRESAYETLQLMAEQAAVAAESTPVTPDQQRARTPSRGSRQTAVEAFANSAMRSLGTQIGRQIVRGVMGSLFGGSRRR